ncbi:unnamed protein product [Allacma fusca]|uniref:O-acyltransferase WSD1 C-terminal domain-containing protein n=1 Tax=Allacma fusca TaxID=39272 RepID=A0A8J2KF85_9HEXA|nr:unnamed protein product [Allacma fusca]
MEKTLKDLSNSAATIGTLGLWRLYAYSPIIMRRYFCSAMISFRASYSSSNFPAITSQHFFDGLELAQFVAFVDLAMYKTGITIMTAGANNKQVFCVSTDKSIFGSEEIANNFGSLILEELQDLAREMV